MMEDTDEPESLASEGLLYLLEGRFVITDHEVDVIVRAGLSAKKGIHAPPSGQPSLDSFGGEFV
jgi:hypothetical protein